MPRSDNLTTGACAELLGVGTGYIRGEIKDGRIKGAIEFKRPSGRNFFRVPIESLRAYCEEYAPAALPKVDRFAEELKRSTAA